MTIFVYTFTEKGQTKYRCPNCEAWDEGQMWDGSGYSSLICTGCGFVFDDDYLGLKEVENAVVPDQPSDARVDSGSSYEFCDCYEQGKIKTSVMCGCDVDHLIWVYRDTPIHWRGGHWALRCAFRQVLAELGELKRGKSEEINKKIPKRPPPKTRRF